MLNLEALKSQEDKVKAWRSFVLDVSDQSKNKRTLDWIDKMTNEHIGKKKKEIDDEED